jgi:hypothetical protein
MRRLNGQEVHIRIITWMVHWRNESKSLPHDADFHLWKRCFVSLLPQQTILSEQARS